MSEQAVHEAISGLLDEDEIAVAWALTIDVAGADDTRYLAHHAGGGHDGSDRPMSWTVLGMLSAGVLVAEQQVMEATTDVEDDDAE